ncbi:hypothetical protein [Aureimonas sp. AU20]|uniref:hypothetical protein n=1 Tax=Aureimonas sp. AU20 TaxID=1349819 RepID=UPI00071FA988|nr:hypothetical protein [Aureimonas sp. AU20]ALN72813.1 hypothetical protein M673_08790 [Aureimonas sp. AU20]
MARLLIGRAVSEHDGIAFTNLTQGAAIPSYMNEVGLAEDEDDGIITVVAEAYEMDAANPLATPWLTLPRSLET